MITSFQVGMEHLIRLDIQKALPLFKDYLVIMNELVEHPDPRYIDCEEAYKQCLWLENRGYKPKPANAQWIKGGQWLKTLMRYEPISQASADNGHQDYYQQIVPMCAGLFALDLFSNELLSSLGPV